jgi:inositol transport system ATP-binding protein
MTVLEARSLSKSFTGVQALRGVSLDIRRGEVHALVGENGAGKSTLMKILAGQLRADSGSVEFRGARGVAMIYQELLTFPALTVAENICMGREPAGRFPGTVDRQAMRREAAALLERLGSSLDPNRRMHGLSVGVMQMVEIAKALAREAEAILMDEPTSALSAHETDRLFNVVRDLTARGVAVIYTSHKLAEVFRIADRITVLRDGHRVATHPASELNEQRLIALMVGRELEAAPGRAPTAGASKHEQAALEVRKLSKPGKLVGINLKVQKGEILGITGLMGAGRTTLASALFGLAPAASGEIRVNGRPVRIANPSDAISNGIAMVTEDRKASGIVPRTSVERNLTLPSLAAVSHGPWIDGRAESTVARAQMRALSIKASSPHQEIVALSGGNQQKVMIGKALLTKPDILILDEPTRGIDIGAKMEIHELIRRLARGGKAILMISSEMPEILALSDRIVVMRSGAISAELDPSTATQEQILERAMPEGA